MKKILISLLSVVFCISVSGQNSALLRLNLEKNKVYRMKMVSDQTIAQTVNGIQQNVVSKSNFTISLKMIDMTEDILVTEVRFDTIMTNTNSMGRTTVVNSAVEGDIKSSETGDILSCIMNRLSRNAVYVKMDFTGKPVEIINLKMLSDMILKDTSSITLTGPVAAAVKTQVAASIGEDNLKRMIEMFTWTLPAREISKGESWDMTQQFNSGGMLLDIKAKYHFDEINGDLAKITSESNISAVENAAPMKSGGATVTYDNLQGMSKSSLVIDIRTGLKTDEKSKTHIAGNLGVSAPGFNMQIPMDINGETALKALQ